jgi:hypothetical protein
VSSHSFAETTAIVCQAFDQACTALDDTRQPDSLKPAIATRMIEIVTRGERNPAEICEAALISLGLKPNPFVISVRL